MLDLIFVLFNSSLTVSFAVGGYDDPSKPFMPPPTHRAAYYLELRSLSPSVSNSAYGIKRSTFRFLLSPVWRVLTAVYVQVVLGDKSEQKAFTYNGITCFNPGSFSCDSTFIAYRPCTREVELSALPA